MNNNFKLWLDTFIDEKDLPMEDTFTVDKNGTLNIMIAHKDEQKQLKNMIVKIDFNNGNILDYFKHLGQAISKEVA